MKHILLLLAAASALVCSCSVDVPEQKCTPVRLSLETEATKSSLGGTEVETRVVDVTVAVYRSGGGDLAACGYYSAGEEMAFELPRIYRYDVYVLANMGDCRSELPLSSSGMAEFCWMLPSFESMKTAGLPMRGRKENVGVDDDWKVLLSRLVGRIDLTVDFGTIDWAKGAHEWFDIASIRVKGANRRLSPFSESGSRALTASDTCEGDFELSPEDGISAFSGVWKGSFYVPENLHGNLLPSNTDPYGKNRTALMESGISETEADALTYIEVEILNVNGQAMFTGITCDLKTRFYLGSDDLSNFDVAGNTTAAVALKWSSSRNIFTGFEWKLEPENLVDCNRLEFECGSDTVDGSEDLVVRVRQSTENPVKWYYNRRGSWWEEYEAAGDEEHGFSRLWADGMISWSADKNQYTISKAAGGEYAGQTFVLGVRNLSTIPANNKATLSLYFLGHVDYNTGDFAGAHQGQEITLKVTGLASSKAASFSRESGSCPLILTPVVTAAGNAERSCKVYFSGSGTAKIKVSDGTTTEVLEIPVSPVYFKLDGVPVAYMHLDGSRAAGSYISDSSTGLLSENIVYPSYTDADGNVIPLSEFSSRFKADVLQCHPHDYVGMEQVSATSTAGYPGYCFFLKDIPESQLPSSLTNWNSGSDRCAALQDFGVYGSASRADGSSTVDVKTKVICPVQLSTIYRAGYIENWDGAEGLNDETRARYCEVNNTEGYRSAVWFGSSYTKCVIPDLSSGADKDLVRKGIDDACISWVNEYDNGATASGGSYVHCYGDATNPKVYYLPLGSDGGRGPATTSVCIKNSRSGSKYRLAVATYTKRNVILLCRGFRNRFHADFGKGEYRPGKVFSAAMLEYFANLPGLPSTTHYYYEHTDDPWYCTVGTYNWPGAPTTDIGGSRKWWCCYDANFPRWNNGTNVCVELTGYDYCLYLGNFTTDTAILDWAGSCTVKCSLLTAQTERFNYTSDGYYSLRRAVFPLDGAESADEAPSVYRFPTTGSLAAPCGFRVVYHTDNEMTMNWDGILVPARYSLSDYSRLGQSDGASADRSRAEALYSIELTDPGLPSYCSVYEAEIFE